MDGGKRCALWILVEGTWGVRMTEISRWRRRAGGRVVERDDFMHSYHNFSLVNQKRMLEVFVHSSFPIRVFWERRDR